MTTARDIMTPSARYVNENDTLVAAARLMRDHDIGSLPVCGDDDRLKGMLTDRDIVVRCIAEGHDAGQMRARQLADGKPVTVGADDDIDVVLKTMKEHAVRRLPVIDGHELVGIVSQGDVARHIDEDKVGDLVASISD